MAGFDKLGRRLKFNDLRAFMAVVDAGGIGKGAERLNYSQPAVSKAIAGLERAIGRRLLERSRKGVELTSYGRALRNCGMAVFDDLRKGFADIEFLSDPTVGEVRIGCTENVSVGIVSAVTNQLARKYPRMVFHLVVREPTRLVQELESRNVDFVVTQLIGHIAEQHQVEVLYHEPIVIIAGARHPCARRRRLDLAELADQSWTLPLPRTFIYRCLADAFRAKGLNPPKVAVFAGTPQVRLMLVSAGYFLTIVPAPLLKGSLRRLPIKAVPVKLPGNSRPIGIITLKDRALSPLAQLFIQHARSAAKEMAVP